MTEPRKPYLVNGVTDHIPGEKLKPFRQWEPPTGGEIQAALQLAGWTGEKFAKTIGINPRTVRRWLDGDSDIPYAVWAMLCVAAGLGQIWVPIDE